MKVIHKEKGEFDLFVWTKRLGQRHYALEGFIDATLCGLPLFGNNYAKEIPVKIQEECVECRRILDQEFEEVKK